MKELTTAVSQSMSSLQIAEITGKQHAHVMEAIRTMESAWQKVSQSNFRLASYVDKQGKERPCYHLSKAECLYIATKFNDESRARLILRWEELETGKATPIAAQSSNVADRIRVAKFLASFLQLNEASKLELAKSIADPMGLPTPDYVPSKGILRAARELLKECGSELSSEKFNKLMVAHGMMVEMSRPSTSGVVKKFKSIVGDGLIYGENQVNPKSPRSTQPLYYADKFQELLAIITNNPK